MTIHSEMVAAQFVRSVANGQRYLVALRADQAYDRLASQDGRYHLPRSMQRHMAQLRYPFSPARLALHAQPTAFVGPAATDLEKLQAHVMATNPSEIGYIMRHDPVVRTAGVAVVVAVGAEVAAAALTEEAAAYATWRWLGWGAAGTRFVANVAGQEIGYTISTGNPKTAFRKINWVSPILSAAGAPLITTSIGSAAFKVDVDNGHRSVLNGGVKGYDFTRDFFLNYGFGQATRLSGMDNWCNSPQAQSVTGGLRYQINLRLSPRFAQGASAAVPKVLDAVNRTASGALRKYGAEEAKKHLPK